MSARQRDTANAYKALLMDIAAMPPAQRAEFLAQFERVSPEEQAEAMVSAGREAEEFGRGFEDLKGGAV